MAGKHYATDGNILSLCIDTAKDDVYTDGSFATGPQPSDYCSGCGAAEPEWEHVEDEEFRKILNSIY
jgi:hypothetical protein